MDCVAIKQKLAVLSNRAWPEEWGPREEAEIGDFYGWCHRYRLDAPLEEGEVAAFERVHGVSLPAEYRQFLTELGNGGAGPYYGMYRLGEGEEDLLEPEIIDRVGDDFAHAQAWNDTALPMDETGYYGYGVMAGAVPVSTKGGALDFWLVISGPQACQIWLDQRTDNGGVAPVTGPDGDPMTFGRWYESWLDTAFEKFAQS